MNLQLLASVKGTVQGAIERRALLAGIPQRLIKLLGTSAGSFEQLTLATSFLQEKKDGTFQRILAAPLSKTALLIGKLLPYYLVNLIQVALMFCVGGRGGRNEARESSGPDPCFFGPGGGGERSRTPGGVPG